MTRRSPLPLARLPRLAAGAACLMAAACGQEEAPQPTAPPNIVVLPQSTPAPRAAVPAPRAAAPARPAAPADSEAERNRALARRVKEALLARPELKAHGIDVIVRGGGAVTLFGTSDSAAYRSLAGQLAAGVEGVKTVENRLVIASGS